MRRFLINTGLFLLPLIAAGALMEVLLRAIPNDYLYKRDFLDKSAENVEILFLGTSHAYYGINPEFISGKAFNASHVSQTIDYDYEVFTKYKNRWDNLKYIVISVDYATLYSRLSMGDGSWRIKNYEIYYDISKEPGLIYHSEVLSVNTGLNFKRLYKYYLMNQSAITCSELGYGNIYRKPKNLTRSGKDAAKRHTKSNKEYFESNIALIQSIVEFAARNEIEVIFYTSPVFHSYVANMDKEQWEATVRTIQNITSKNQHCLYYNFLTDSTFKASDFMDADHLNSSGAKKLSLKLNAVIHN